MSFSAIATAMAKPGVHLVPTYPGLRHPALANWQNLATTDPETISNWGSNGYAEYNGCYRCEKAGRPEGDCVCSPKFVDKAAEVSRGV